MLRLSLFLIALQWSVHSSAQSNLQTIDGVMTELLTQISLKKGDKMDTAAVRNLFIPTAQLTILMNETDSAYAETVTLNDFLELITDPYYEEGYSEKEIYRVIDQYNGMAQVFQSFKAKDSEGESGRGITSYQLVQMENRWWIVNILWTNEVEGMPLPKKYLKGKQ
ncbi:hypothetical protein [Flammeovirga sp. SubArs3]|uniref:hypothetical protein n=1 Tax=Flammeovirga sp. SubArs3 TaxID=2995316 RepID=UPI00248AAF02|nr:hypothetical protein [Flammeovirga sp. SubArs3]